MLLGKKSRIIPIQRDQESFENGNVGGGKAMTTMVKTTDCLTSSEKWQVERDGGLIPGEYDFRSDAIQAAWADAFKSERETETQMLAVMMRPPRDYAVVLVAGVAEFGPNRLGSWDEGMNS